MHGELPGKNCKSQKGLKVGRNIETKTYFFNENTHQLMKNNYPSISDFHAMANFTNLYDLYLTHDYIFKLYTKTI